MGILLDLKNKPTDFFIFIIPKSMMAAVAVIMENYEIGHKLKNIRAVGVRNAMKLSFAFYDQSVSSATEHTSSVTYVTQNTQYTYLLKSRSYQNIEEKYAL